MMMMNSYREDWSWSSKRTLSKYSRSERRTHAAEMTRSCDGAKSTRRMAIANGTCVSFCNQSKAQFGYLRRVTPVCRCLHSFCGWRHLATSRESKAHFCLPCVRPWDNRGNVTQLERGFNACKTPRCIYPSIFNHFWYIASYWSKIATFSYPNSV